MKAPLEKYFKVADWYLVREIAKDVFWVNEPGHVSFYIFRQGDRGLFIDSGLGLSNDLAKALLQFLGISEFSVYCTHAHCDHVGLNDFARKVYLSREEWEKYLRQDEVRQLQHYHDLLKAEKTWPDIDLVRSRPWKPSGWIADGDVIKFDNWHLRAISVPGHTSGSVAYLEETEGFFFLGDFLYAGTLYLHFRDSSFGAYQKSLSKVLSVAKDRAVTLWPAHNQIPLDLEYLQELSDGIEFLKKNEIPVSGIWAKSAMFEDGVEFQKGRVKIVLRRDEYESFNVH